MFSNNNAFIWFREIFLHRDDESEFPAFLITLKWAQDGQEKVFCERWSKFSRFFLLCLRGRRVSFLHLFPFCRHVMEQGSCFMATRVASSHSRRRDNMRAETQWITSGVTVQQDDLKVAFCAFINNRSICDDRVINVSRQIGVTVECALSREFERPISFRWQIKIQFALKCWVRFKL